MSTSFSPESATTRTADSFLGEGIPNETADRLSNSFLEGKGSSNEGSLEDSFLRDADKYRDVDQSVSTKEARRADLDQFLECEKNPEARLAACVEYAKQGSYFRSQDPGHLHKFEGLVKELGPIPGVEKNLRQIGGESYNSGKGHYTELGRAACLKRNGVDILEINKDVVTSQGATDIDILSRQKNGELRWDENKCENKISLDEAFQKKINKMSAAVEEGLQVEVNGKMEPITRAVFTNSVKISPAAIEYGQGKGVEVYEKRPYTKPVL